MLAGPLFILYYAMGNTVWGEGVIDGGKVYQKQEAIAKDQEIAAEFTGPLTEETVRAIWEKYGAPVNYDSRSTTWDQLAAAAAEGGNDNYCNRFVVKMFGEAVTEADGGTTYVLKEGWEDSRYLQGNYIFGYAGSSSWYWDRFQLAFILAQVVGDTGKIFILPFGRFCARILTQVNMDMIGAGERLGALGSVKREAGERPTRSRRCERGVLLPPHWHNEIRVDNAVKVTGNSWEDEAR